MGYFHREGAPYITVGIILSTLTYGLFVYTTSIYLLLGFFFVFTYLIFCLQFFRYPHRPTPELAANEIISPADGKLVANEILADGRRQLSIFMSPLNVHANWVPIAGQVIRSEYIPGKYLVAWHPKSSTENERHEVDIQYCNQIVITVKQIAGAVARRVRCYLAEGQQIVAGDEHGFIKFGSRVDLLIPADSEILVGMNQKVTGNFTIIARLKTSN
jgi:phosphatidylserine decarboxylase